MSFEKANDEYEKQREIQRKNLSKCLETHAGIIAAGLEVVADGNPGKGSRHYTSNGKISQFDLRNWKWVQVKSADGFDCVISLNMPDVAPSTGVPISLLNRIGLCISYKNESYYYETEIYTDIDLPLDDTKKEKIAQLVLDQYKIFSERPKEA